MTTQTERPDEEREHLIRFIVTVNTFGHRSKVIQSTADTVCRILHLAFGNRATVALRTDHNICPITYAPEQGERGRAIIHDCDHPRQNVVESKRVCADCNMEIA